MREETSLVYNDINARNKSIDLLVEAILRLWRRSCSDTLLHCWCIQCSVLSTNRNTPRHILHILYKKSVLSRMTYSKISRFWSSVNFWRKLHSFGLSSDYFVVFCARFWFSSNFIERMLEVLLLYFIPIIYPNILPSYVIPIFIT